MMCYFLFYVSFCIAYRKQPYTNQQKKAVGEKKHSNMKTIWMEGFYNSHCVTLNTYKHNMIDIEYNINIYIYMILTNKLY